jgi:hypothetical protein
MGKKYIDPRYFLIRDKDDKLFNIIGPIDEDDSWYKKIEQAQKMGRNVRCEYPNPGHTRDQIKSNVEIELGLIYTDKILV